MRASVLKYYFIFLIICHFYFLCFFFFLCVKKKKKKEKRKSISFSKPVTEKPTFHKIFNKMPLGVELFWVKLPLSERQDRKFMVTMPLPRYLSLSIVWNFYSQSSPLINYSKYALFYFIKLLFLVIISN